MGKVAEKATAAAQGFLDSDGDAVAKMVAAGLERKRKNGGDRQDSGNSDGSSAGFAWRWRWIRDESGTVRSPLPMLE